MDSSYTLDPNLHGQRSVDTWQSKWPKEGRAIDEDNIIPSPRTECGSAMQDIRNAHFYLIFWSVLWPMFLKLFTQTMLFLQIHVFTSVVSFAWNDTVTLSLSFPPYKHKRKTSPMLCIVCMLFFCRVIAPWHPLIMKLANLTKIKILFTFYGFSLSHAYLQDPLREREALKYE